MSLQGINLLQFLDDKTANQSLAMWIIAFLRRTALVNEAPTYVESDLLNAFSLSSCFHKALHNSVKRSRQKRAGVPVQGIFSSVILSIVAFDMCR